MSLITPEEREALERRRKHIQCNNKRESPYYQESGKEKWIAALEGMDARLLANALVRDHPADDGEDCDLSRQELLSHLKDLLAVIHRDGGHYTGTFGIAKAVEDGINIAAKAVQESNTQTDDDKQVTEKWWFENYKGCYELDDVFMLYLDGDGVVVLHAENASTAYSRPLPHIKTRGDVRRLFKSLTGENSDATD